MNNKLQEELSFLFQHVSIDFGHDAFGHFYRRLVEILVTKMDEI